MKYLDRLECPNSIIGGVAVIAHGFARATADIDAAVVATPDDVDKLLRSATRAGLEPRVDDAAAFARENLVLLLRHGATGVPVDVSLALQDFEREAALHAEVRMMAGTRVRVAPLTAMLVYKMVAGRPKDREDVAALLATHASFDREVVDRTLAQFDELLDTDRATEFRLLCAGRS